MLPFFSLFRRNESNIVSLHCRWVKAKLVEFDGVKRDSVIAVAMSGGVDSAVTAAMLVRQGYRVFGLTAKMTREYSRCCADEDITRAAAMCEQLGIDHRVVDVCDAFQADVIDNFMTSYLNGETPSPCVVCNRTIKFGVLLERALGLGAHALATGHYVRYVERDGVPHLKRGADARKDQSYFLARLGPETLRRALFPLGDMQKRAVSALAAEFALEARKSRESQELCFVTEGTHGEWIDLRHLQAPGEGDIVDTSGQVLGQHRGVHHYTIGQRKGLGLALGYPVYVIAIEAHRNRVVVGEREAAMGREVSLRDVWWVTGAPPASASLLCQVRYNHRPARGVVTALPECRGRVVFETPQFAITPGQLVVFYDDDVVVGSGWIAAS